MDKLSFVNTSSPEKIEELYNNFLENPDSIPEGWQNFFKGFEFSQKKYPISESKYSENYDKEFKVLNLIKDYRDRGHLFTKTNPVRNRRTYKPTLDIENYGLSEKDLNTTFQAGNEIGTGATTLSKIIAHLKNTYCESIGVEYTHLKNKRETDWIKNKIEITNLPKYSKEKKKSILEKLNQAVIFEQFLHKKFVGQKRFSLEGNETLIPALSMIVEKGAELGIKEFIFGMSHRGRLNVLTNIFNKTYQSIFTEFEGKGYEDNLFDGDVKYHLGYSCSLNTNNNKNIHLTLSPNPSHLEAVMPVVLGITRSKIDTYLNDNNTIVPIVMHGDAAISGQGIMYEVIQMSQLDGFRIGGTIHIVINNQIGFTTNYLDGRSSIYCTDVSKVTECPVFHVNGDDVEAVSQVMEIAVEYRQVFKKDIFIDILGYRKYGHNEGDEPRFTQPLLYKAIAKQKNPRDIYVETLLEKNIITEEENKKFRDNFKEDLEEKLNQSKQIEKAVVTKFLKKSWEFINYKVEKSDYENAPKTSVKEEKLIQLANIAFQLPKNKPFIKKIARLFNERLLMATKEKVYDWALGELMAYATLLEEGFAVRITGQDVERGTFSHRHAVVKVEDSEEEIIPLQNIKTDKKQFHIYNSLLSEYAVLGYEYGYGMASPNCLTIWEAQFGDFNNGAQIIFDQFISAAEEKWKTKNGLVILLPHGYEGQGAEHSSARVERFLQLCAENNMIIANCSTPASFFHILRRQLQWKNRKPLIVFTPKSLLRHPKCVSPIKDFTNGKFEPVIESKIENKAQVKKLVFCTGKFYYDILQNMEEKNIKKDINLIRIEQLYPFPKKTLQEIIKNYPKAKLIWAQEEPKNMGAWSFILSKTLNMGVQFEVISLPESGAPATGSSKTHTIRHNKILSEIFEL